MQLTTKLILLVCACTTSFVIASDNGLLYGCDFIDNTNDLGLVCDFVAAADVDIDPVPHDIQSVLDATNPANRIVADPTGKELPISPKPWSNGDVIAEADTAISGYYVNYVRAFEIVAPLRDLLMYQADTIDQAEFDKWTKSFVDCDIKAETVTATPFDIVSVADTWTNMFWDEDPSGEVGPSQHNWILQFLEEGAIDLVCITTDLEMDHCDEIRSHHDMVAGDVSSCWVAGYEAAYGVAPEYFDGEAIVNADTNTDTNTDTSTDTNTDTSTDVNPPDIDGPTPPDFDGTPPDIDGERPNRPDGSTSLPDFDGTPPDIDGERPNRPDGSTSPPDVDGEMRKERPAKFEDEFAVPEFTDCTEQGLWDTCVGILVDTYDFLDISADISEQFDNLTNEELIDEICTPDSDSSIVAGCLSVGYVDCGETADLINVKEVVDGVRLFADLTCGGQNSDFFVDFEDYDGPKVPGGGKDIFSAEGFCYDPNGNVLQGECSGHGQCFEDVICDCDDGWAGLFCSKNEEERNNSIFGGCEFDVDENGDVCSGHGECDDRDFCVCDTDYSGRVCEFDGEATQAENNRRQKEDAFFLELFAFEELWADCDGVLCPPGSEFEDECKSKMSECNVDSQSNKSKRMGCMDVVGTGLGDFDNMTDEESSECAKLLAPSPKCTGDTVRCWDGECAASEDDCSEDECALEGLVSCGDGITCAENSSECIHEFGVMLEDCPVGEFACTFDGFPCAATWEECYAFTGCTAEASLGCSPSYLDSGAPNLNSDGIHVFDCAVDEDTCAAEYDLISWAGVKDTNGKSKKGQPVGISDDEGNFFAELELEGDEEMDFSITKPSQSELNESPFGSKNLFSAALEVVPGGQLDGEVKFKLAITTPLVNGSCETTVGLLDPRKVANIRSANATLEDAGKCSEITDEGPYNCTCVFYTTSFSTVALVDAVSEEATEEAAAASATKDEVSTTVESATTADSANDATTTTTTTTTDTTTTIPTTGTTSSPGSRASVGVVMLLAVVGLFL